MYDYDRRYAARYARIIRAMSVDQAKQVLGFPPGAAPSPLEVSKAYKTKAIQNHPDRGGTHEVMVDLNAAKDILEGKRREDRHPPVSWGGSGPMADPEAARRAEEDRKRHQALNSISAGMQAATSAAELAIQGTDLIGYRINLGSWLNNEYRQTLDKMHNEIEDTEIKTKDMLKAQNILHMLTGMSHRLGERFLALMKMNGDATAALIGLGGQHLNWLSVAAIYFEMKRFIAAYGDFKKMSGNLNGLIVTSENVPHPWVDLYHPAHAMIDQFERDFQRFSDHPLKQFGMVMQKAAKEVMMVAEPYGFAHHGDWQKWAVPGDFEQAQKIVMGSSN